MTWAGWDRASPQPSEGSWSAPLGPEDDPTSRAITGLLARFGIRHHPIRVEGTEADRTLLLTSGGFGDKLPVGFRGCHASLANLVPWAAQPSGLRVVASLPNRLAAEALRGPADVRVFAPALRNMLDREPPVSAFVDSIDVLCCNRGEWESLDDREQVAWQLSILAVTDGPDGATVRFTTPEGEAGQIHVPAFPRAHPPRDTNRAGEAFASTLILTLVEAGWTSGVTVPDLVQVAAERASAASALVLDIEGFGFPTPEEVELRPPGRPGRMSRGESLDLLDRRTYGIISGQKVRETRVGRGGRRLITLIRGVLRSVGEEELTLAVEPMRGRGPDPRVSPPAAPDEGRRDGRRCTRSSISRGTRWAGG